MARAQHETLIAGSGAVGSYYGGRLAQHGLPVRFLARGAHLRALQRAGLALQSIDGDATVAPVAASPAVPEAPVAVIVVAVKAYQTAAILDTIAPAVGPDTLIVSLQNGLDNEEAIAARYGAERTVGAVAFIGSERVAPGRIRHTAAGQVTLGPWAPATAPRIAALVDQWRAAGLRAQYAEDIRSVLWHKLLWNAAFNTTTCLAGCTSTALLALPEGEALVRAAMAEIRAVATAEGATLPTGAEDAYVAHTRTMGDVRTSMLVDREHGRRLEVEAISGTVVRRAEHHGIAVPVQRSLYAMLKAYDVAVAGAPEKA